MRPRGGYIGRILRVDLSRRKARSQELPWQDVALLLGGRGLAAKILLGECPPGIDPFDPCNRVVVATGPLTGTPVPGSGKCVIASKSPLTYGYGDGCVGGYFGPMLKMAGFDAIIIEGRAEKPVYILVQDGGCEILPAEDLWGLTTSQCEQELKRRHGEDCAVLCIGPAGEHLVRFATLIHDYGRAGGRPGMGAVLGSKKVKAIVVKGEGEIPVADPDKMLELYLEACEKLKQNEMYREWLSKGTTSTVEWSQRNSCLPTRNFQEGVFDGHYLIGGDVVAKFLKYGTRGCFACVMPCGNMCRFGNIWVEVDYEQLAMLGSNIGVDNILAVAYLTKLSDELGLDSISLGNVIGFAMELYERGILTRDETEGLDLRFGNYDAAVELTIRIAYRKGLGNILAEGVRKAAEIIGRGAWRYAMHCKGLEITAYDCHAAPGMALAYATSSIGAHHKDAWFIAQEVKIGRDVVSRDKVLALVRMQNIRGGIFETLVVCRLPWVELGLPLEYYPKFLEAATGLSYSLQDLETVGERVLNLIRCYWIREWGGWNPEYEYPPYRWISEPLTQGPLAGSKIDLDKYKRLLNLYYEVRGWDERGIPRISTLKRLGLSYVADELEKIGIRLQE